MKLYSIRYIFLSNGKSPIIDWLNSLDSITKKRINQRILRIQEGNFGDHKKINELISELRFFFGKGYRIYYAIVENTVVLLINGGDKSKQSDDVKKATEIFNEWRLLNERIK